MYLNLNEIFKLFQITDVNDLILCYENIINSNIQIVDKTTFMINANNEIIEDIENIMLDPKRGIRLVKMSTMMITDNANNVIFSILDTVNKKDQTIFLYIAPDGRIIQNRHIRIATIDKFNTPKIKWINALDI